MVMKNEYRSARWIISFACMVFLVTGCASTGTPETQPCPAGQMSNMGILSTTDKGQHWTDLGHICFYSPGLQAVDTVALASDGRIVLHFINLSELGAPATTMRNLYRSSSTDGVHFEKPAIVYSQAHNMVDPTVVHLANGSFAAYIPSEGDGLLGAASADGLTFTKTGTASLLFHGSTPPALGGMPNAIQLSDGKIRLYANGAKDGIQGIYSYLSTDGIHFELEAGIRIGAQPGRSVDDPAVIRLADGGYLMSHSEYPGAGDPGPNPWYHQYYLASSPDGLAWTDIATMSVRSGTAGLAQAKDGTIFFYYGGLAP